MVPFLRAHGPLVTKKKRGGGNILQGHIPIPRSQGTEPPPRLNQTQPALASTQASSFSPAALGPAGRSKEPWAGLDSEPWLERGLHSPPVLPVSTRKVAHTKPLTPPVELLGRIPRHCEGSDGSEAGCHSRPKEVGQPGSKEPEEELGEGVCMGEGKGK